MGEVVTRFASREQVATSIERLRGSDCTGDDGATNRTLVLASTPTNLLVFRNGQLLTLTEDYTLSSATITFLGAIDNTDFLTAEYEV